MATDMNTQPLTPVPIPEKVVLTEHSQPDITIYSHSPLLYWWPIWLVGFILALTTYQDGHYLAHVPPGTVVEGNRLVAPEGRELGLTHDRVAVNPYLGTIFLLTLVVVMLSSTVQTRGLWAWIAMLAIALVVMVVSLLHLWGAFGGWFRALHIYINLGGYLFLSVTLFVVWALSVFVFDRLTYVTFTSGQVRIRNQIGQADKVYDVTNMTFQVQPNVFLRHRVLGWWGAGDLIITTGGPHAEVLEWPNVLFARSRLRQIQERLKSREVV